MSTTKSVQTINLNILSTYSPTWSLTHGLRELVANTLDEGGTMVVVNSQAHFRTPTSPKVSHLTIIGYTSKSDKPSSIGQFGEGFKVGVNAILRVGGKVTVRSSNWTMTLSHEPSHDDPTLKLLTATVETDSELPPSEGCEIMVKHQDITQDLISRLYTRDPLGPIVKPSVSPARIYCKGMFIQQLKQHSIHDYNLDLLINRDRSQVNPFDLNRKIISALNTRGLSLEEVQAILTNPTLLEHQAFIDSAHHLGSHIVGMIKQHLTNTLGKKFVLASTNDQHNTRAARKGYAVAFLHAGIIQHLLNFDGFESASSETLFSTSENFSQRTVEEKVMIPLNDLMDTIGVSVPVVFFEDFHSAPLGKAVMSNGSNTVMLNERLLAPGQKQELYATFLHELAHINTGAADCTEIFEEGLTKLLGQLARELLRR